MKVILVKELPSHVGNRKGKKKEQHLTLTCVNLSPQQENHNFLKHVRLITRQQGDQDAIIFKQHIHEAKRDAQATIGPVLVLVPILTTRSWNFM